MSTLLYRIGMTSYRRPWRVIGVWLGLIAVIATALAAGTVRVSSEIRIQGTPAQQVLDELAVRMPAASGGQASIVFQAPEGDRVDSPAHAVGIARAVSDIYQIDRVIDPRAALAAHAGAGTDPTAGQAANPAANPAAAGAPGPLIVDGQPVPGVLVSGDGRVALLQVQFTQQIFELPAGTVDDVVAAAERGTAGTGIAVLSGATLGIPQILGVGEGVGVVVAAIVLLLTLASVVAAGLPLLTALTGVAVGVGGTYALSSVIELNSAAAVLALMLGLAVGMDYALFIVNRQRRGILDHGLTAHEAAGRAVGTAGSAVFFAGLTVIIALVALLVVNVTVLTSMALIAAATVGIAVLVALTLLPALMGLAGERICTPQERARARAHADQRDGATPAGQRGGATPADQRGGATPATAPGERWARLVIRHRYATIAAVVVLLGLVAVPMAGMRLGLPSGQSYNSDTPQRRSYDAVATSLGAGYNGPLLVVASATQPGTPIAPPALGQLTAELATLDGVSSVTPSGASDSGDTVVLAVIPTTGPTDPATEDLVRTIRADAPGYAQNLGVTVGVTGITAMAIDVSQRLADVLPRYLAVVLVLSLVVLLLVFRSVFVPIKATIGFLLSVLAAFGATTAVFQWGWLQGLLGIDATTPVLSFLPIITTGVLYGLAMDYEVFLVSSMRESYVHGHRGIDTAVQGFRQASRVVMGAAIIMTSVFTGFVFNHDPMIKQIGFALAFGILADAFVVRLTLVPAVMAMFGDNAWWLPRWLDRLLPNLDVEGDRLVNSLRAQQDRAPGAGALPDGPAPSAGADAAAGRHTARS